jgi:glycerol-3-phosphate O-acyltransferase 1/2
MYPGGLLSIAFDALLTKKVEDILVVPVNFSYERLLEGNYIREQLGKPKVKESFFTAALGLWNSVQTKFGNARVDFGKPFSVKVSSYMEQYHRHAKLITNA